MVRDGFDSGAGRVRQTRWHHSELSLHGLFSRFTPARKSEQINTAQVTNLCRGSVFRWGGCGIAGDVGNDPDPRKELRRLLLRFRSENCEVPSVFLFRQICLRSRGEQLKSVFVGGRPHFRQEAVFAVTMEDDLAIRAGGLA